MDEPKVNILLVDDHPENLLALEASLEDLGQNLVTARSGKEALKWLLKDEFAVILLDVHMPGMDGFETASLIRQRQKTRHTPIIFITGVSSSETHVFRGYSLGAVDYLFKPIVAEIVRAKVEVFVDLFLKTEEVKRQTELRHEIIRERERERERERKRQAAYHRKLARTKLRLEKEKSEALAQKAAELERSNAELEQFAYVASHDLQEPLRMVASYVQLLAKKYEGNLDEKADKYIGYAVEGVKRMQRLINDLLAYSRVGTRGKPCEPLDTSAVVDEVVAALELALRESGGEVTRDGLPTVMADETQFFQLFQNLIGNALKFHGPDAPRVYVGAERNGSEWTFSVSDNGIGIDARYAERIFMVFKRLHERGAYPGNGIGLAIAKKIVERHEGRIWVESRPGKGATFRFTVPVSGES